MTTTALCSTGADVVVQPIIDVVGEDVNFDVVDL